MRERSVVRQESRAFQVEETACAKSQGRREQRTAGHWISLELEMCDEVDRGHGCRQCCLPGRTLSAKGHALYSVRVGQSVESVQSGE